MGTTYLGISYPFRRGKKAVPEPAKDDQTLADSIAQIVMTSRGERVMRPDFGTNTIAAVFEAPTPDTLQILSADIQAAITKYEPRVIVKRVNVVPTTADRTKQMEGILVEITFQSKLTGKIATVKAQTA